MKALADEMPFEAILRRPSAAGADAAWAFVVLPKAVSDRLPRRGRTSVHGSLNGHPFEAVLEPDGQLSHWLTIPQALLERAGVAAGQAVTLQIQPSPQEQEPTLPPDFQSALESTPAAMATWNATTTIARIDWVHWIESAKQAKTRSSRITDACDMLAQGKKRVCCFDPSGYYSKSLCPPREAPTGPDC